MDIDLVVGTRATSEASTTSMAGEDNLEDIVGGVSEDQHSFSEEEETSHYPWNLGFANIAKSLLLLEVERDFIVSYPVYWNEGGLTDDGIPSYRWYADFEPRPCDELSSLRCLSL